MKQAQILSIFICSFFTLHFAQAQTAALSFVNPTIVGNKLQVTIHVACLGGSFGIGNTNFRFNYPTNVLANPTVLQENFPSPAFGTTTTTGTNTATGIVSINTILNQTTPSNSNVITVTPQGVELVVVEFTILNPSAAVNINWRITSPKTSILDDDKVTNVAISSVHDLINGQQTGSVFSAGADVTLDCVNHTASLQILGGIPPYTWSTGAVAYSINVSPTVTTTYSVTATNGLTDNVLVTVNKTQPTVNAGPDLSVNCYNPSVTLSATSNLPVSFRWSSGDTHVTPSVTTTYTVTVTAFGSCTATDQVVVVTDKIPPTVNLGADISVACNATALVPVTSTGTTGGVTYLWNTGSTLASINVSPTLSAIYRATVTKITNGCKASDEMILLNSCNAGIKVAAKVFLASIGSNGKLSDYYTFDYTNNNFPLSDPYAVAPLNTAYTHVNNNTIATIMPSILLSFGGDNTIVDWIFLELRQGVSGSTTVAYTKTALLQADGDIVAMDGVSPVSFPNGVSGLYYVAVRYRNHLGFRTANKISLSNTATNLNFTNNSVPLHGTSPLTSVWYLSNNHYIMVPGDANFDGSIDSSDDGVFQQSNGSFNNYVDLITDYNLDGSVDGADSALWELNNGKYQELD